MVGRAVSVTKNHMTFGTLSYQEHMIKGAGNCTYGKVQNCSPTFNKLASDMFPYKELLEPSLRAHTEYLNDVSSKENQIPVPHWTSGLISCQMPLPYMEKRMSLVITMLTAPTFEN